MIIDAEGDIVATDDPAIRKSMDGKVLSAIEVEDPVLASVARSAITENEETTFNTRIQEPRGTWWEAESEPLAVDWGPKWNLVIAIPDSELLSGVREVHSRMLLAGALILIGCALIGFAVARCRRGEAYRRFCEWQLVCEQLPTVRVSNDARLGRRGAIALPDVIEHLRHGATSIVTRRRRPRDEV